MVFSATNYLHQQSTTVCTSSHMPSEYIWNNTYFGFDTMMLLSCWQGTNELLISCRCYLVGHCSCFLDFSESPVNDSCDFRGMNELLLDSFWIKNRDLSGIGCCSEGYSEALGVMCTEHINSGMQTCRLERELDAGWGFISHSLVVNS